MVMLRILVSVGDTAVVSLKLTNPICLEKRPFFSRRKMNSEASSLNVITRAFEPYAHRHGRGVAIAAAIATFLFVSGMALLGTSRLSGYLYAASIIVGAPLIVIFLMRQVPIIPGPAKLYAAFIFAFFALCTAHVAFMGVRISIFDSAGRLVFGLSNGLFAYLFFEGRRDKIFSLIVLVAGSHATAAISYTLYNGIDFSTLTLTGERIGGTGNPIPFSLLHITSLGILVIAIADRIRPDRKLVPIAAIALLLTASLLATVIGGTRGTLIIMPWLFVILTAQIWLRLGKAWGGTMIAAGAIGVGVAATYVFQRDQEMWLLVQGFFSGSPEFLADSPAGLRAAMWLAAIQLIPEAPLFGHGFIFFSDILASTSEPTAMVQSISEFGHVHNDYLDLLLKAGIVGTVLFYGPMVTALAGSTRLVRSSEERVHGMAIIWVVGAYLIYGLTSVTLAHASTTLQLGVYLGLLIWLVPAETKNSSRLLSA
jgi:O-antigen ligase